MGLDIPNANTIVIDAHNFGLSATSIERSSWKIIDKHTVIY